MADNAWLNFHCSTHHQTRIATFRHNGKEWQLAEVAADPLPEVPEGGGIAGRIPMTGKFGIARDYPGCPGCGADSYARCGNCAELGCWRSTSKTYKCAKCGHGGRVSGRIDSANAMDVA